MAKWKVKKASAGTKCRACGKDISNKKAYVKKSTSMGSFLMNNIVTGFSYCSQSCFNSRVN